MFAVSEIEGGGVIDHKERELKNWTIKGHFLKSFKQIFLIFFISPHKNINNPNLFGGKTLFKGEDMIQETTHPDVCAPLQPCVFWL